MPNIWTHICFCESIADMTSQPAPFIKLDAIMKLGAQGPNLFRYYRFWTGQKNNSVQSLSKILHTEECGPFIMDLIQSAKNERLEIKAYVFGFVTHHILDRHVHPYIHYFAGHEANQHQSLETIIDTILMKKYYNLATWKAPVYKELDVGYSVNNDIVELLDYGVKKYYPEFAFSSPKYIQKAYKDMKLALKMLYDPYGWKNKLFGSFISPYSYQPVKQDVDYLNLKKATWYHSATNERRTESFEELFAQAKLIGIEIINELHSYWKNGSEATKNRLTNLIGNISYDTGMAVNLNLKNKYSQPILQHKQSKNSG